VTHPTVAQGTRPADRREPSGSRFAPFTLWRRGTLALPALSALVPTRTWDLLEQADLRTAERAGLRDALIDELHDLVPALEAQHRRVVLRIKRDVYGDRKPDRAVLAKVEALVPDRTFAAIQTWLGLADDTAKLVEAARSALTEEMALGRRALADLARNDDFLLGVQLSGQEVFREVESYLADLSRTEGMESSTSSRRRRVERTTVSFAYRSALKPTPFGSFTELGAQPWRVEERGDVDGSGSRVRLARASLGLLSWMGHELRRIDGSDELLRIRVNNTVEFEEGRLSVFVRGADGDPDGFGAERYVALPSTPGLRRVVEMLTRQPLTQRELIDRLVRSGIRPEEARRLVDRLVETGLCHRGLEIADQTSRYAAAVAARLRAVASAQAADCAEVFEQIQWVEDEFASADAARRKALVAHLEAQVAHFVELVGLEPPPEVERSTVFEDVGTRAAACSWNPSALERNADNLALMQRLLGLLDRTTVERLGLYAFFTACFGRAGQPVGLLDLYREFGRLSVHELSEIMLGKDDPYAQRIESLRRDFFDHLHEMTDGTERLRIDPSWLRRFVAALPPDIEPWRSAAYRIQFAEEIDSTLLVVNGVTAGNGVFFSRHCELLEPDEDGWSLQGALRAYIRDTQPRQADLIAVLGMNFNIHPRLSPLEIVYPGSIARDPLGEDLSLRDLVVTADSRRRRLDLISRRDGEPVDLVPLNFLYPIAAPRLYRFLAGFGPTRSYRGGLWEQAPRGAPTHLPRVMLGDLVLDRRTWRLPVDEVPHAKGSPPDVDDMAKLERWRVAAGLPRECFVRVARAQPERADDLDWMEETRRWALEARSARLHKPHYLDFHNPFLLHVFCRQLASARGGRLTVQECLPATHAYASGFPASAEEFFIEHTLHTGR